VRLVRANHRVAAPSATSAGTTYDVRVADQDDIVNAMTAGAKVETAGSADDQPELPIT
jgi:predicted transcriptional regulator